MAQDRRRVGGSAEPDNCMMDIRLHCIALIRDFFACCVICWISTGARECSDCSGYTQDVSEYLWSSRGASEMFELTLNCSGSFWSTRNVSEYSRSLGIAEHISEMLEMFTKCLNVSRVFGTSRKWEGCRPRDLSCVHKRFPFVAGLRNRKCWQNC